MTLPFLPWGAALGSQLESAKRESGFCSVRNLQQTKVRPGKATGLGIALLTRVYNGCEAGIAALDMSLLRPAIRNQGVLTHSPL